MHTVKGKKITVTHLLGAAGSASSLCPSPGETGPFRGASTADHAWPGQGGHWSEGALWATQAQIFGFREPQSST